MAGCGDTGPTGHAGPCGEAGGVPLQGLAFGLRHPDRRTETGQRRRLHSAPIGRRERKGPVCPLLHLFVLEVELAPSVSRGRKSGPPWGITSPLTPQRACTGGGDLPSPSRTDCVGLHRALWPLGQGCNLSKRPHAPSRGSSRLRSYPPEGQRWEELLPDRATPAEGWAGAAGCPRPPRPAELGHSRIDGDQLSRPVQE